MLEGILTIILMIGGVLMTRSITTLVHEYGHALPALLFTKGKVEVYIGSYGNIDNAMVVNLGRLTTYIKFNFLNWRMGLCRHEGGINIPKDMLIVLGGPIASVLLSIPLIMVYQTEGLSDIWRFLIPIFVASAIYDFLINMIPFTAPMRMHDGSITYNDGQQLKSLFRYATKPEAYLNGMNLFYEKKYEEAITEFQQLINQDIHDKKVYITIANCLFMQNKYGEALNFYEQISNHFSLKREDFSLLGSLHLKLKNYDSALQNLNKSLYKEPHSIEDLTLRGRVFIQFEDYQEAMFDLNNAIRLGENYVDAYASRGLLHIRLNELEAAKWDLDKAFSIDENHALTYLHLGYLYEKKGDFLSNKEALIAFQKAQELGVDESNIDWLIAEAARQINFNS